MSETSETIDVEAERVAFSIAREGVHYCDCMLEGWLARARLAAEREREMVDLLREAQREGCTRCYSDAVGLPCCYPHSAQCLRITAALRRVKAEQEDEE